MAETDSQRINRITRDLAAGKMPPEFAKTMPPKSASKPVKVPFAHVIEFDWFRTFSWKERLQILLGYALEVAIRVPTRHKPGELGVLVMGQTTHFEHPTEMLKERARDAVEATYGDRMVKVVDG